ncbi:hypothetical protein BKA93DRAFT_744757 [Sparassis latifolia]
MSSTHLQYGDFAMQLLTESRRSMATDTLLKYNEVLIHSILCEQRQLLQATLNTADQDLVVNNPKMSTVLLYQTAVLHNKQCLLAYHHCHLWKIIYTRLKDLYWSVSGALPLLLSMPSASASQNVNSSSGGNSESPVDVHLKLSLHEVDLLQSHMAFLLTLCTVVFAVDMQAEDIDLLAPITHPLKDLHILVHIVRDCGVHTKQGAIDFRPGHTFSVCRSDVEHLIMQGFLEEI